VDKLIEDLLKIGIPSVLGTISTYISYRLGKRQSIDAIRIEKCFDHGGKVAKTLLEIEEIYSSLSTSFRTNFQHVQTVTETMEYFEELHLYEDMKRDIQTLSEKRASLRAEIKMASIYLKTKFLDRVEEYLKLGDFSYDTDGGLFVNTYYENFFENLLDEATEKKRLALFASLKKELRVVGRP